ncbi:MAG: acyl-CoA dehydrogenase family protein, partial [bacterium]
MPTAEQIEIRSLALEFARGEIRPHGEAWDAAGRLPEEIFGKLAELGFLGMRVPESHGGLGLDEVTWALVLEALAWGDPAVALAVSIHGGPVTEAVASRGSEVQKGRWLPALAAGEALGAFALSEPEAGSDPTRISATARPDGEGWILEGDKRWVTNGSRAGLLLTFLRTGGKPGEREGVSAFLVPGDAEGLTVRRRERTLGLRASETVTLEFQGVRVPADGLLGLE